MRPMEKMVPEGEGFEVDYDEYNLDPDRKFSTADEWWRSYCCLDKEKLERSNIREELLAEVNNDVYLAMAINHFVGKNYKSWLDKDGIDVLGGLTPRQCMGTSYGMKRLRMLFLMAH